MQYVAVLKLVPDVVEELEVGPDGRSLDEGCLRPIVSECSDHALEQALLLKETYGGEVTAVALDPIGAPEADDALFSALAKGADRAIKLAVAGAAGRVPLEADALAGWVRVRAEGWGGECLILCGSQAIDDLEGELGAHLAAELGWPYVSVVTAVAWDKSVNLFTITKEFAGGVRGVFRAAPPAVLGIQAAEKPPRYVPVARIRAAMKTGSIETVEAEAAAAAPPGPATEALFKPEPTGRARMLEGEPEAVAGQLVALFEQEGLL